MKSSLAVVVLVLGVGSSPAAEMDKAQLRKLACLPQFRVDLVLNLRCKSETSEPATASSRQKQAQADDKKSVVWRLPLTDLLARRGQAKLLNSRKVVAELRRIARSSPNDPETIASAILIELIIGVQDLQANKKKLDEAIKNLPNNGKHDLAELLPPESRDFYLWSMKRLKQLAISPTPKVAAAACESWADVLTVTHHTFKVDSVFFELEDPTDTILDLLRYAVKIDPSRERAWDLLIFTLSESKQTAAASEAACNRVAVKDNAHTRFLLGKLYAEQGKFEPAYKELEAGLRTEPEDLACRLGMLALQIKREELASAKRVAEQLDALAPAIKQQKDEAFAVCYQLLRGIQAALNNDVARAGNTFREVLRQDAGNTTAGRALVALGRPLSAADKPLALAYLRANRVKFSSKKESPGGPITCARIPWERTTDEILFFLTSLPQLRDLHLPGSGITDAALIYLQSFPDLESLEIDCKTITDQGLTHIRGLQKLRSLDLSFDENANSSLSYLQPLHNLESLSIRQSSSLKPNPRRGSDASIAHLKKLTNLRNLSLSLDITDEGVVHIASLPRIRTLCLFSDKITDKGLIHLQRLKNLERLSLMSETVTDAGLAYFKEIPFLRELHLERCSITDAGMVHLKGLTSLRELDLRGARISDTGLSQLHELTELRDLDVGAGYSFEDRLPLLATDKKPKAAKPPRVTNAGLRHLRGMTKLEKLSLEGHAITDEGLQQLSGFRHLDYLNLTGTEVSSKAIAQFCKKRPGLRVSP